MRPDSGEAIGLQLHFDGERLLRARILFLQLSQFTLDAKNILHVMAKLVCDFISLSKFTRSAEAAL